MKSDLSRRASVKFLDFVDSTNAEALRLAKAGEHGPLWIVAKEQSTGRGRRGRAWISPVGNLHATLMLIDPAPAAAAPQLGFVAALALHDAAVAAAPALTSRLALKWPNDLLCAGRKIAGILIEGEGDPLDAAMLFDHLAAAMQARLALWNRGAGFADVRAAWLSRALGLGQPIRVRLPERETTGRFETIDEAGRLVLRTARGEVETVAAGDVFPFGQAA